VEIPPSAQSKGQGNGGDYNQNLTDQDYDYPLPSPDDSKSFFQFEFETDAPRSDSFDGRNRKSTHSVKDDDSIYPVGSPARKPPSVSASPRVSKRFSKRASILPPPALDLLFETSEPVPQIPEQFRMTSYSLHLHPYAVRGLREYEDSLDEYDVSSHVWASRGLSASMKTDYRRLIDS